MSRLRKPVRVIREPFGKAGLTLAILALVLAMVGGAWAAGALSSKQKKEVTAIAKKYAGKPGAPGEKGGPGEKGTQGEKGPQGEKGLKGDTGTNGKSVVLGNTAPTCPEGGTSVEVEGNVASMQEICNGEEGTQGPQGEPWTPNNTLPTGATETGAFGAAGVAQSIGASFALPVPIGFPIQIASALPMSKAHLIGFGEGEGGFLPLNPAITAHECKGNAKSPGAASGNLCIFITETNNNVDFNGEPPVLAFGHTWVDRAGELEEGISKTGALLLIHPCTGNNAGSPCFGEDHGTEPVSAYGTWAVTG